MGFWEVHRRAQVDSKEDALAGLGFRRISRPPLHHRCRLNGDSDGLIL